jgi:hypothetical protein
VTVGRDRTRVVRANDTLQVGGSKTDSIGANYLIEAGSQIRLVCGKSVLEFNADGAINISGTSFTVFASNTGVIDTGNRLDINGKIAGEMDAKGQGVKGTIEGRVEAVFGEKPGS